MDTTSSAPDPNTRLVLDCKMTRDEFVSTWRRYMVRRPQGWLLVPVGIVIAGIGAAFQSPPAMVFGAFFAVYTLLDLLLISPARMWSKSPLHDGYVLEVGTETVKATAPDITSELAWSRWRKVVKCGNAYALQSRRSVLFVPVHTFANLDDEATFRDLAAAASAGSPR